MMLYLRQRWLQFLKSAVQSIRGFVALFLGRDAPLDFDACLNGLFVVLSFLVFPFILSGADYYVSVNSADSNNGTSPDTPIRQAQTCRWVTVPSQYFSIR